jgi:hypothetical protein
MNQEPDPSHDAVEAGQTERHHALDRIQIALRGLRYGTVTAVVHDGVVVQVERTEEIRLPARRESGA